MLVAATITSPSTRRAWQTSCRTAKNASTMWMGDPQSLRCGNLFLVSCAYRVAALLSHHRRRAGIVRRYPARGAIGIAPAHPLVWTHRPALDRVQNVLGSPIVTAGPEPAVVYVAQPRSK